MNSIVNSNSIVKVKDLSFTHNLKNGFGGTLRDSFINLFSNDRESSKSSIEVFKNFNLEILKGERIGILGKNGSGKTTLCRLLAGMYRPESGDIQVLGNPRAILNNSSGMIEELTGIENARMLVDLFYPESCKEEQDKIVMETINFSELNSFTEVPLKKYSKGMKARLYLSLISARSSDLLILDEVFDGTDIHFKEKISKRVHKMIQDSGAVVFVSHELEQIQKVCNRVIILGDNQILFDGDVQEGLKLYSDCNS